MGSNDERQIDQVTELIDEMVGMCTPLQDQKIDAGLLPLLVRLQALVAENHSPANGGDGIEGDHYDQLTKLPNRQMLKERLTEALARAWRSGKMVGLVILGIDNFKMINDSLGHETGDRILQDVGKRLVSATRAGDTITRFGGDEFALILEDIADTQGAIIACKKMVECFADPFDFDGQEHYVTASMGLAFYPADSEEKDTLIQNAEIALHRSKDTGKNSYSFFTAEMNDTVQRRLELESKMRKGLLKGEFIAYFQPKVDLEQAKIIGMEALVRWLTEDGSVISPGEFVPLAEETGLIVEIGMQVLLQATKFAKELHDEGFDINVSVNLSSKQLDQKNLIESVQQALDSSGLPPRFLWLEVTESGMSIDPARAISLLNNIKKLGVNVSMDDFGTGYSSLSQLKKLPIDELKIDRSFVINLPNDIEDMTIANAIVSMAQALHLRVTAEGVEEIEQLEFLQGLGCEEIQGFYYSPPLSPDNFREYIRKTVI